MIARRLDAQSLSDAHLTAWKDLHRQSFPEGNAFLSPGFFRAASRSYARVRVCVIERDGEIAAFLPFQFKSAFSASLGAAERLAEEMNDSFGVVAREGIRMAPAEWMRAANLNHCYFTHLHESQIRFGLTGETISNGLRIAFPQGGTAYWDALAAADPKMAKDSERRLRKAEREFGKLEFELDAAGAPELLERLLKAKSEQYLRTGKRDLFAVPERKRLLRALAVTNEPECRAIVSTLSFGGVWAAIHFGLVSARTLHYWFPVYNPAFAAFAPGRLLLREIVLAANKIGIEFIDRGVGQSKAKQDFPSEQRRYYSGTWWRPGAQSLVYRARLSASWRLSALAGNKRPAEDQEP